MYKGSCLCGEVIFEITGVIKNIIYCHCSKCRKAQGSAFATNGNVEEQSFNIICGKENQTEYKAGQDQYKYFCKKCGSPIMSKKGSIPGLVRVRLGTIDTEIKENQKPIFLFYQRPIGKKYRMIYPNIMRIHKNIRY